MPGYMTIGYENIFTILLSVIGLVIVVWAQSRINRAFQRTKQIKIASALTGQEVARKVLDAAGLHDVHVVKVQGTLTDHYDPTRKVVRLSSDIFDGSTVAATAIAAHECGHAIQDKEGYLFMRIRSFLAPVVNFVTYAGYFVAILSLLAGVTGYFTVAIYMILASILFQLVTLPVEFDASARAKKQVHSLSLVTSEEAENVKDMLGAAAMTYVASFLSSILNLIRLLIMRDNSRDD